MLTVNCLDPSPDLVAERNAKLAEYQTPEARNARARMRDESRQRGLEWGCDYTDRHRNGSGNGAPFEAKLVEAGLVITWYGYEPGAEDESPVGMVAIPLDELTQALELPPVADGGLVTRIDRVFTDEAGAGAAVLVCEAWSRPYRNPKHGVEHVDRKIVAVHPLPGPDGMDRVAVLDLRLVVEEQDSSGTTNGWRPETWRSWALDCLTAEVT